MANILLVDDDPGILKLHGEFLRRAGHTVATAANGKEALQQARSQAFDLLITDLIMPEKEGLETIFEIRKLAPSTKIVAMSGGGRMSPKDYLFLAQKFGASQTLAKPFSGQELTDAITRALAE